MAVNTNEEYLDELLQSIDPVIHPEAYEDKDIAGENQAVLDDSVEVVAEPIEASVGEITPEVVTEPELESVPEAVTGPEVETVPETVIEPLAESIIEDTGKTVSEEAIVAEKVAGEPPYLENSGITYENLMVDPDEDMHTIPSTIGGEDKVAMSGIDSMVIDAYKKREESSPSDSPLTVYNREDKEGVAEGGISLEVKRGEVNLAPQEAVDPEGMNSKATIAVTKELGEDENFKKPSEGVNLTVKTASSIAPMNLHSEEENGPALSAKKYSGIIAPPPEKKEEKNPNVLPDIIPVGDEEDLVIPQDNQEEEMAMSEEEIDALLISARESAENHPKEDQDNMDVSELLKQFSQDEDIADIHSMLEKDSIGEMLDDSSNPVGKQLDQEKEEKEIGKNKKKQKKSLFSFLKHNKKKEEEGPEEDDLATDLEEPEIIDLNQLLSGEEKKDASAEKNVKKKLP